MSYFQDIDAWLEAVLSATEEDIDEEEGEFSDERWLTRVKKQLKDKLLESYRNGIKAGGQPQASRQEPEAKRGAERRKFRFPRKR